MKSKNPSRRKFLADASIAVGAVCAGVGIGGPSEATADLLPPTAGSETDFLSRCIRCFRCVEACTVGSIQIHGPEVGPERAHTPFVAPRYRACIVCTDCTHVCPTDALMPVDRTPEAKLEHIEMGKAAVNQALCLSYLGRVCGVCDDACPFGVEAIRLLAWARPEVLEGCVGCGRCEERCPQVPAAIRVFVNGGDNRSWIGPARLGREDR